MPGINAGDITRKECTNVSGGKIIHIVSQSSNM